MKESDVGIIFLGISERAAYVRDGNTNLFKWNILGLKQCVLSHIFPVSLNGWSLTIAVKASSLSNNTLIKIFDERNNEVGYIELKHGEAVELPPSLSQRSSGGPFVLAPKDGWSLFSFPLENTSLSIFQPGLYSLKVADKDDFIHIGQMSFYFVESPRLTPERIAAIKSDPTSIKAVRMVLSCNVCNDTMKIYAALERDDEKQEGYSWYEEIDNRFICGCGKADIDNSYIKRNLHGLIGHLKNDNVQLGYVPLYERSILEQILHDFKSLVNDEVKEEIIQKYIQDHTVLLHQFPAEKILFKPPLLNKHIADFAILTPQKELILIEIERSNTKLLKQGGHLAAPLSHAIDQVRDWLHCTDEHRLAVLDDLGFSKDDVGQIRGVVIAGVDSGYDAAHLRKLKSQDWGRVTFLTYDDLSSALNSLINKVHKAH